MHENVYKIRAPESKIIVYVQAKNRKTHIEKKTLFHIK